LHFRFERKKLLFLLWAGNEILIKDPAGPSEGSQGSQRGFLAPTYLLLLNDGTVVVVEAEGARGLRGLQGIYQSDAYG
jgi:hypothetical protein